MSKDNYINIRLFSSKPALNHFVKKFRKYAGKTIKDSLDKLYEDKRIPDHYRYILEDDKLYLEKTMYDGRIYSAYPYLTFVDFSFRSNSVEDVVTMFSILVSFIIPESNPYQIYYSSENDNDVRYSNYDDFLFGDCNRYTVEFYGDEDEYTAGEDDEYCLSGYERLDYPSKFSMISALNAIFKKNYSSNIELEDIEEDLGCQINTTYEGLTNKYLTEDCPWLRKSISR